MSGVCWEVGGGSEREGGRRERRRERERGREGKRERERERERERRVRWKNEEKFWVGWTW